MYGAALFCLTGFLRHMRVAASMITRRVPCPNWAGAGAFETFPHLQRFRTFAVIDADPHEMIPGIARRTIPDRYPFRYKNAGYF